MRACEEKPSEVTASQTGALLTNLLRCETAVWQALVSGSREADAAALDPGFLGVYPSGFAGKADHVGQLDHGPVMEHFTLSQAQVLPLSPGLALLAYRADFRRRAAASDEAFLVSSIWRETVGPGKAHGWINIFSQDTPLAL